MEPLIKVNAAISDNENSWSAVKPPQCRAWPKSVTHTTERVSGIQIALDSSSIRLPKIHIIIHMNIAGHSYRQTRSSSDSHSLGCPFFIWSTFAVVCACHFPSLHFFFCQLLLCRATPSLVHGNAVELFGFRLTEQCQSLIIYWWISCVGIFSVAAHNIYRYIH